MSTFAISQRQVDELTIRIGRLEEQIRVKDAALLAAAEVFEDALAWFDSEGLGHEAERMEQARDHARETAA